MGYVSDNLNKNEEIIKEAKLSIARLILSILGGVLFFWVLLIPLFKAIKAVIRYFTTELAFTNKRVIGKAGSVDSGSLDAPLNKIQNVSVSSGLWGKILHYGTIEISTAGGKIRFEGIQDAESFKRALMNQVEVYEEDRVKAQAEEMAAAMASAMKQN